MVLGGDHVNLTNIPYASQFSETDTDQFFVRIIFLVTEIAHRYPPF